MTTKTIDEKIEERVKEELTPLSETKLEDMYDEMLDDCYGRVEIVGMKYSTSYALKELDPTAYRCGFNDWIDNEVSDGRISEEIAGNYYDADEVQNIRDEVESEEEEING